ncbi:unnamed protein product, partial [marine sediment metagenome]
ILYINIDFSPGLKRGREVSLSETEGDGVHSLNIGRYVVPGHTIPAGRPHRKAPIFVNQGYRNTVDFEFYRIGELGLRKNALIPLSSLPGDQLPRLLIFPYSDKIGHLIEYAILGGAGIPGSLHYQGSFPGK